MYLFKFKFINFKPQSSYTPLTSIYDLNSSSWRVLKKKKSNETKSKALKSDHGLGK